jgi:hypothetical protein
VDAATRHRQRANGWIELVVVDVNAAREGTCSARSSAEDTVAAQAASVFPWFLPVGGRDSIPADNY